jgi:valyl-tRNA synthetase
LAPFLPFATDEVWRWWQPGSVHAQSWPLDAGWRAPSGDQAVLDAASAVLGEVRRAKTEAKVSMRAPVAHAHVVAPAAVLDALAAVQDDVREAGTIAALTSAEGDALAVTVTLAPPAA